jgi:predicted oxidoreductase
MKEIEIATLRASTLTELHDGYYDFKKNHNIIAVDIIVNRISVDWFEMMVVYREI